MATTVPTLPTATGTMDTLFTTTWFEVQKKAIDNILEANVFTAALKTNGCFRKQRGGRHIERTLRHGTKTAIAVAKGDTLPTGEDEVETAALWDWKYLEVHVQRSLQDDQQNAGPAKIKSLVATKIQVARDALADKFESALLATIDTTLASGGYECRPARDPYSLQNMLPTVTAGTAGVPTSSYLGSSYTYGKIATGTDTGNTWWCPKGQTANAPYMANMLQDMRSLYNYCTKGSGDHPDLIGMRQAQFEGYEDLCSANIQLVQDVGSPLAKLGYNVFKYKGAQLVCDHSSTLRDATIFMWNTKHIDVVYDPSTWFAMTPWMYLNNQLERITRIVCAFSGAITGQLRRHGVTSAYTS